MSATTILLQQLKELGLTQTEIAKRTRIPQPRLSRWAAGRTAVGADDALRLRDLFDEINPTGAPSTPAAQTPQEQTHAA